MEHKIKIELEKYNIVAELYNYDDAHPEIAVFLEDKNECVFQDITLVRPHSEEPSGTIDEEMIDCLVWGDHKSEDYTKKFVIPKYDEDC